jgi:DnaJ homolog subfamily C member 28
MDKWENIAEKKIQEAMSEGAFDNLKGAGRPIDLSDDPFEPPDLRMAHRLLRNNGLAPPWIEEAKDLRVAIAKARAQLARAWEKYRLAVHQNRSGPAQECWEKALEAFRREARSLNQRVTAQNLKAPSMQVHTPCLNVDNEIEKITR